MVRRAEAVCWGVGLAGASSSSPTVEETDASVLLGPCSFTSPIASSSLAPSPDRGRLPSLKSEHELRAQRPLALELGLQGGRVVAGLGPGGADRIRHISEVDLDFG